MENNSAALLQSGDSSIHGAAWATQKELMIAGALEKPCEYNVRKTEKSVYMFLRVCLLVIAVGVDIFVASAAYGTNEIGISDGQIGMICGMSSLCLGGSVWLGSLLDGRIPERFTKEICFFSLLTLGCLKLADSGIRRYLRNHEAMHKDISFGFSQLRFLISVYSDPMEADRDRDQNLSWREAGFLAAAVSIDCILSGALAAFLKIPLLWTAVSALIVGEAFAYLGLWMGKKIKRCCPGDLSWVGGILFLILAVTKR